MNTIRRTTAGWVRWHAVELGAVTTPTVAAVTVSPWWALLSVVAAGRWVLLETRTPRDVPAPPPEPLRAVDGRDTDDDEDATA